MNPRPTVLETAALPTELHSYAQRPLKTATLLRLAVLGVLAATRTVLPQLQTSRRVLLVLAGGVVPLFAVRARHPDDQSIVLSHNLPASQMRVSADAPAKPPMGVEPMTPFLPRKCATAALGRRD